MEKYEVQQSIVQGKLTWLVGRGCRRPLRGDDVKVGSER